jgi:LytR cell envelope-related transcriptional attenuator
VVASAIAAVELILLLGLGAKLLSQPLSHVIEQQAKTVAASTTAKAPKPSPSLAKAIKKQSAPPGKARPRDKVRIMVFNGNGLNGAAGQTAGRLQGLGYKIAGTANASHENYATSVVMYEEGYRAEGIRLAHDLGVKVVGPLDGITAKALDGGQLAVIVGA